VARSRKDAPEVAGSVAGDPAEIRTGPTRGHTPKADRKRGRGAPKHNLNAAVLASSKARARAQRDRDRRTARADLRAIVRERGAENRADVRLVVKLLGMLLPTLYRYLRAAERAPDSSAAGSPRTEHSRLVEQASRVVNMLRELFDLCAVQGDGGTAMTRDEARAVVWKLHDRFPDLLEFQACLNDGEPITLGYGQGAARSPETFDPVATEGLGLPVPPAALQPHVAVLPAHPADVRAPAPAALPPSEPATIAATATHETEAQRTAAWWDEYDRRMGDE
jgi:hypothetical protein